MNKILSWKINSSTYAYIYVPNSTTYISNRIPEDSPLWSSIVYEISGWDYNTYYTNFQKMSKEVNEKYGVVIPWDELYWNFVDENSVGNVNIVLLAGKDSAGGGANVGNGGEGAEVYEELRDAINKELDKAKKDIEEQNKRVQEFVEQKVGETISEAKNTIAETKKELTETRAELEDKLEGATEALDKAAALFDMGEGNISGEDIKNALSSVDEYGGWLEEYSGTVKNLKTDYDLATQRMGSIGEAEDATDGLFARFATSLNVVSGTVGNVERSMNASQGLIEDFASWYNTNASSATEASRFINAMSGQIVDSIDFISGDGLTTRLTREMNAFSGTIRDEIMTKTSSAITNVTNEINGLDGRLTTAITRLDTLSGSLTSMGEEWDAINNSMEEWINVSDSAMSLSQDLRDTWSIASGKLSTVSNLTAETDEKGEIMYFVSGATGNEIRVTKNLNGKWLDASGYEYSEERVYVHWSQAIGSYIQQQASSITMSVMNSSGLTAAIRLAIERGESGEEESVIKLISDKLVITGDMIAQAISANTANIGGIHMGMGQIWSEASNGNGTPKFRLDGVKGTLYANSAEISGAITASSLTLKNGEPIETYVKGQIPKDLTSKSDVKEMISAYVDSEEFKQSIVGGYITQEDLEKWAATQDNLTEEQVEALVEKLAGSEVNAPLDDVITDDGGIQHSIKIGGEVFSWVTYDADKFVVIGSELSGGTEEHPTKFMVSKEGLLTAKNAFVQGKIIASEGFFQGRIEANEGFFNGAITATSLTLGPDYGSKNITEYIDEKVPSDVTSSADVNEMISAYVSTQEFKNSITDGCITDKELEEWAKSQTGLTEDDVNKLIDTWGNTKVNTTFTSTTENGQTEYVLSIGGKEFKWYTYELTDENGNGFVVLNRPYTGETETGKTSVLVSTEGLLQAHNAIIHGCIHAIAGEIGGLILNDSRLMVSRNGNYDDSIAYLNGSRTYSDSERGTIILAAGISSGRTYHKYTSIADTEYSTIYTKKQYSVKSGDTSGCEVEAYEYDASTKTYRRLVNQFYFLTIKSIEKPTEADIIHTVESDGNTFFTRQCVVRKYFQVVAEGALDEMVDEYSYQGTFQNEDIETNTRIFEDGTIMSNTLVAGDGYFGGEINSIGRFRGTLENVGGSLKGVTVDANLINGNIVIRNSDSIKAKNNSQLYFNVGKEPLSDKATKEYWNIDEVFWEGQNSNGTNEGILYHKTSTIALVAFKSGATIKIPELKGSMSRYAAANRTNNASYLWVECSIRYSDKATEEDPIGKTIEAPEHSDKTWQPIDISTSAYTFSAQKDGVLTIKFGYSVHLSTYSWLGSDKSYGILKFNGGGSSITVEYPKPTEGVSIASNGMRVLTVSGASLSIIDDKITLLSPNRQYGLKITNDGLYKRTGTGEEDWAKL